MLVEEAVAELLGVREAADVEQRAQAARTFLSEAWTAAAAIGGFSRASPSSGGAR